MARRVLVQRQDQTFDLAEVPAPSEHALQEVMKANPQLIPSDDLGLDGDLLVVGRETSLASGAIDLLCLARSGDLVLIEFKTGPQNPDFRHALAQLIDYGSDLWKLPLEDFDRGVVQRYLRGSHCQPHFRSVKDLSGLVDKSGWNLREEDRESLNTRLTEVLENGDFIYVVAAQRFTTGMTTSLDYLNATMRQGRFFLVEVVRLEGQDLAAHAAQVVAAPVGRGGSGQASSTSQASESEFLARISSNAYREAMKNFFSACAALGLTVFWGAKGASIRLPTPDRQEPLSVGWAFLDRDQWSGAKHLTLGVDQSSLQHTPSVEGAVTAFVQRIKDIPGGRPVQGSLDAYIFEPDVVPTAATAIIEALGVLAEDVQGGDRETGA